MILVPNFFNFKYEEVFSASILSNSKLSFSHFLNTNFAVPKFQNWSSCHANIFNVGCCLPDILIVLQPRLTEQPMLLQLLLKEQNVVINLQWASNAQRK